MYARSLFPLIFFLAQGHGATKPTDQKNSFIDLRTNRPVDIEESVPYLVKCCPMNQILLRNVSVGSDMESSICISNPDVYGIESPFDYSNSLDIYNKDIKETIVKTKKKLTDFTFLSHEKFLNLSCCVNFLEIFDPNNTYVTEDGRLLRQKFNYYDNWSPDYDTENFCFEHEIYVDEMGTISTSPSIALYGIATPVSDLINNREVVSAYSMLVSCWFLLLVLVVYGLLKELRNLAGMMLMAYVATLTVAFLTRAAQVFANDVEALDPNQCVVVGLFFLYSLMASFTWLNVMSFDIWWSMRGFRKCRKNPQAGDTDQVRVVLPLRLGVPLMLILFHIENEFVKRWDRGSNYTKTTSTRGKRNALDSLTENSDMGEASATDYINRVKCNSTKPQYPILNDSNHQGCPTYQLLGKNTSF
ncbi:uncharacterized protein [Choristoneura fumiferana]|uniref:uncharacterized protein n=1 Tax=Choristoneura fumiferana TaxID=7141 RepID=UPI003D15D82A